MTMHETFYPVQVWIEYPQDHLEENRYKYVCRSCRRSTLEIQGRLENHALDCEFRRQHTYIEIED